MTWDVTASFSPQGCTGQASTSFKLTEFCLAPPKAGPVIQVADGADLALSFSASKTASAYG